jgi:hypothetical protein
VPIRACALKRNGAQACTSWINGLDYRWFFPNSLQSINQFSPDFYLFETIQTFPDPLKAQSYREKGKKGFLSCPFVPAR